MSPSRNSTEKENVSPTVSKTEEKLLERKEMNEGVSLPGSTIEVGPSQQKVSTGNKGTTLEEALSQMDHDIKSAEAQESESNNPSAPPTPEKHQWKWIILISLDSEAHPDFDRIHSEVLKTVSTFTNIFRARSIEEAHTALKYAKNIMLVLVVDNAILREVKKKGHRTLMSRLTEWIKHGGTALFCCDFARELTTPFSEWNGIWKRLNLPWRFGNYTEHRYRLNPALGLEYKHKLSIELMKSVPPTAGAITLLNVPRASQLYVPFGQRTRARRGGDLAFQNTPSFASFTVDMLLDINKLAQNLALARGSKTASKKKKKKGSSTVKTASSSTASKPSIRTKKKSAGSVSQTTIAAIARVGKGWVGYSGARATEPGIVMGFLDRQEMEYIFENYDTTAAGSKILTQIRDKDEKQPSHGYNTIRFDDARNEQAITSGSEGGIRFKDGGSDRAEHGGSDRGDSDEADADTSGSDYAEHGDSHGSEISDGDGDTIEYRGRNCSSEQVASSGSVQVEDLEELD